MLSYLYRLVTDYQRSHGCHPNLVYLNRLHYCMLRANLAGLDNEEEIARFLGMNIVISPEIRHPDVAWVTSARQKSAVGRH